MSNYSSAGCMKEQHSGGVYILDMVGMLVHIPSLELHKEREVMVWTLQRKVQSLVTLDLMDITVLAL